MDKYHPRPYQKNILNALNSGIKRAVWVVHRRGGKDITIFNWCIYRLLTEVCTCFYVLPTYSQAKKVIWDSITIEGFRFFDYIPDKIIQSKNKQELKINLINGSTLQLIGSDNIDSLVGTNPKIIVFSEYAIQSPAAWDYLRPILDVNKGYAVFISTPRGKNHFYDLLNMAKTNPDKWFSEVLTINDTGVLSDSNLQQARLENMSDELIQQEFYCSFNRGVEGSYYGKIIEKCRETKRICNVPYETRSVVNTAWDIGYGDSTSIVFWQDIGGEVRIIDFYENQGEGLAHYAKIIQNKPYVYGTHYLPHDAGSGSFQTGRTVQDIAWEQGIKTTLLQREIDIQVGIEAVRNLLSIVYIDEKNCQHLLKCLENYHKKYNDKTQTYSESPAHDWTSHACFIGSTKILTEKGSIKIEEVRSGDMILTPFGLRKVLETHCRNENEIVDIYVNNKYAFTSTKYHMVFTQRGLTYADSLRYNTLEKYDKIRGVLWKMIGYFYEGQNSKGFKKIILSQKMKNQLCLMDFFIDGMENTIVEQSPHKTRLVLCIEQYGSTIMEILRKKWKFIIGIVIQKTIISKILNAFQLENIKVCTEGCQIHGLNLINVKEACEIKVKRLKRGINLLKAENGINYMPKIVSLAHEESHIQNHVKYADNHMKVMFYGKDFVQTNVKQNIDTNLKLIMKKGFVAFVGRIMNVIDMLSKPHVVTNVESKKCEIQEKVYDLTIDIDGCYYANGYLVSNSDSVRYMANARMQFGRGPGNMTAEKLTQLKSNAGFGPKPRGYIGPQAPFVGR